MFGDYVPLPKPHAYAIGDIVARHPRPIGAVPWILGVVTAVYNGGWAIGVEWPNGRVDVRDVARLIPVAQG